MHDTIRNQLNEDGYVVLEDFLRPAECEELKVAGIELTKNVPEMDQKTVFATTNEQDIQRTKDDYFINSNDKIRFFYEAEAVGTDGKLKVDPTEALNKVGHALHLLHPIFRCYTYSDRVKAVCHQLGFKEPAVVQSMYIYKNPRIGGEDPMHRNALVSAIEENGRNWEEVAMTVNQPKELCQKGFEELVKQCKREENKAKKAIMGTGGGPPNPPKEEDPLNSIKKLIEPQIDGLYTIYDSDTELMSQYQLSLPEQERIKPIEEETISESTLDIGPECTSNIENKTPILKTPIQTRVQILRKKKEAALSIVAHQDATYLHTEPIPPVGFWIALDDATVQNGCLWMAPGSHKSGVHRRLMRNPDKEPAFIYDRPAAVYPESSFTPVPVSRGTCILIHGNVVHKSAHNRSPNSRHGYTFHVIEKLNNHYSEDNWLQEGENAPFLNLYTTPQIV